MNATRASGILLHPTSLPGRFGIGDLGPAAGEFLDALAATGQRWWQMLPLGPTGYGNSPYQSHSSFAGNRLLISPELLVEDGLLTTSDLDDYPRLPDDHVEFEAVGEAKDRLIELAAGRVSASAPEFRAFRASHADWLDDYALFMALKRAHHHRAWNAWEPDLAARRPGALAEARERRAREVHLFEVEQFLFDRQWRRLRGRARERGISLIGDVPIFVAQDSADVWARPDLFELDEVGRPTVVAGVPPDYFAEDGQLWGNPLYRWEAHARAGFAWWIARLKGTTARVDLVRLDHFRGFEAYWEVPASSPTAATGRWVAGPGDAFLEAVRAGLGGLPLIAEDLGEITPAVEALRDRFNLPGMRVLQFGFGDDPGSDIYLPYRYIPHCVAYTGTHDNDTAVGWFHGAGLETTQSPEAIAAERAFVRRYLGTDASAIHWDLIRLVFGSVADTAIIPMQDLLGLGSSARMNTPGHPLGNWRWRMAPGAFGQTVRHRLADLTAICGRWNCEVPDAYRTRRRKAVAPPTVAVRQVDHS
jgi:4-alpha-glucanotransferase